MTTILRLVPRHISPGSEAAGRGVGLWLRHYVARSLCSAGHDRLGALTGVITRSGQGRRLNVREPDTLTVRP